MPPIAKAYSPFDAEGRAAPLSPHEPNVVLLHLAVQRAHAEGEQRRAVWAIAACVLECTADQGAFHLLEGRSRGKFARFDLGPRTADRLRQILDADLVAIRRHEQAFEEVLEFPDVPRPRVVGQRRHRGGGHTFALHRVRTGQFVEERVDQVGDVEPALTERRNPQTDHF